MTLIEFISLITVPITLLATVAIVFVSVALATKKNRLETVQVIQSKNFGANHFSTVGDLWALYFSRLFGDRVLAKRQVITIPIYTLVVSGIFFLTWIAYLYIFKNPTHSFSANLPMNFKQAVSDFYHKGIIATLLIDFVTIQLTKVAIRVGVNSGYYSARFILIFLATLAAAYFIFSFAVFYFRFEDMVHLYVELAPNDSIPLMLYAPFSNMESSLSLFYPQTIIHVTTQGFFSTYFMPEPLIFYCAVAAQVSLLAITLGYQIAMGLERLKNLCIGFVKSVGTPQANANSAIFLVILGLAFIPVIALSVLAMVSSR
jgi:hypothetical protein